MVFSSPVFLFVFLPIVVGLYHVLPNRARNAFLLAASLLFYGWGEPRLAWIIVASGIVNHLFALAVERARRPATQRAVLGLAVVVNLVPLAYYKYGMFAVENWNKLGAWLGVDPAVVPTILMPIGISFFTFQGLSYVVDVYRGATRAERNPATTLLYVAIFPHQIAGPIVRYVDVAEQLRRRTCSWAEVAAGIQRFILGLGKKVLIANSLAGTADAIFEIPDAELTAATAWLGMICYSLQLYFDFSGYSDMAIGLARMFGIRFGENFNYPYIARSVTEFWRRWHISLSNWFRDYVYIPLGGNRAGRFRTYCNLIIVFMLCGLWHGASWTFVAWGLFHGAFLTIERLDGGRILDRLAEPLRHAYALVVVMFGWVLFRSVDLTQAAAFFRALLGGGSATSAEFAFDLYFDSGLALTLAAAVVGMTPLCARLLDAAQRYFDDRRGYGAVVGEFVAGGVRLATLGLIYAASAGSLAASTHNPFIYFRF